MRCCHPPSVVVPGMAASLLDTRGSQQASNNCYYILHQGYHEVGQICLRDKRMTDVVATIGSYQSADDTGDDGIDESAARTYGEGRCAACSRHHTRDQ